MVFFFITLGWAFVSPTWFFIGLLFGSIVGLVRIIQGEHFFSDVVFTFWAVYLVTYLVRLTFGIAHPLTKKRTPKEDVYVGVT